MHVLYLSVQVVFSEYGLLQDRHPVCLPLMSWMYGHLDSLNLCYMGRLLDDTAGGSCRCILLSLGQVGQSHGSMELLPAGLIVSPSATFTSTAVTRKNGLCGSLSLLLYINKCIQYIIKYNISLTSHSGVYHSPMLLKRQNSTVRWNESNWTFIL